MIGEDFKPIKIRGKTALITRVFDDANTAAERRLARSARRRLNKRKMRLSALREIFYQPVTETDESFFQRLDESFLFLEDKSVKSANILFNDVDFKDKDYYKTYPTIFHLRKHLCVSDRKEDIRLIYLALHNIMKKRGHFLNESGDNGDGGDLAQMLVDLRQRMSLILTDADFGLTYETAKKSAAALVAAKGVKGTCEEILRGENCKTAAVKAFYKFLLGDKVDVLHAFNPDEKGIEIAAADDDYEQKCEVISEGLGDGDFMPALKLTYDTIQLAKMGLKEGETVSDLQIRRYELHKEQLRLLKDTVKRLCPEKYNVFFKSYPVDKNKNNKTCNYAKYVYGRELTSNAELAAAVRKMIEPFRGDAAADRILVQLDGEEYMPVPRSSRNAVFGYGLSKREAELIIDKQSPYYPFLRERKEDIIRLLSFKVDYFVGPLNPYDEKINKFSFIVKRKDERVTPFNYNEVIDFEQTQENFISRMTGKCTYLPNEDVLPKNSLLYCEFAALNLINNIRINGKKLDDSQRNNLICQLKKMNSMNVTSLKKWWNKNIFGGECEITGLAEDAKLTMKPFNDIQKFLGREVSYGSSEFEDAEDIIRWLTVFSDKKTRASVIAQKKESLGLNDSQIKSLASLSYTGWGKLSRKLIEQLTVPVRGQPYSVLDIMRYKGKNFMQSLYFEGDGGATINQAIECENSGSFTNAEEAVNALFLSPPVKRGVRQTLRLADEVIKLSKCRPQAVILEFAAEDEKEKTIKKCRVDNLKQLYNVAPKERGEHYNEQLKGGLDEADLSSDRNWLYFLQQGKCMYCGKPLDFAHLSQTTEIDHIIPRSLIKDDSIDNKALVCINCNQEKRVEPLNGKIRNFQQDFWKYLLKHNFISQKKFNSLNIDNFTAKVLEGFINRQLVETRQTIRAVADLIYARYNQMIPVIPVRMDAIKAFRELIDYKKNDGIRLINDFHHAYDAYLAGVVGAFGWLNGDINPIINPNTDSKSRKEHLNNIIKNVKTGDGNKAGKYGFLISKMEQDVIDEDGRVIWKPSRDLAVVKQTLNYKDVTVSKLSFREHGKFFNATKEPAKRKADVLRKKPDYSKYVPLHGNLPPEKYGGYTGVNPAFGVLIEYSKPEKQVKKNSKEIETNRKAPERTREIFSVSRLLKETLNLNDDNLQEKLTQYFKENGMKYEDVTVLRIIPKYQLVEIDDIRYRISGNYLHNAGQLRFERAQTETIAKLFSKHEKADDAEIRALLDAYLVRVSKYYSKYSKFDCKVRKFIECGAFDALTYEGKRNFIDKCLKVTKSGSAQINMTEFSNDEVKFGVSEGILPLSQKDVPKMIFIDQSVSGLIESKKP